MTREEAKAIIRKEYLCVDRNCDIEKSCGRCDLMIPSKEPILQAYKMAMDALEQEPKTGHWIRFKEFENGYYHIKCSECGQYWSIDGHAKTFKYCFNCGARMESEDKE